MTDCRNGGDLDVSFTVLAVLSPDDPGDGVMYPKPTDSLVITPESQDGQSLPTRTSQRPCSPRRVADYFVPTSHHVVDRWIEA